MKKRNLSKTKKGISELKTFTITKLNNPNTIFGGWAGDTIWDTTSKNISK
ncbi:hypothetical protein ACFQ1M_11995 [Sungkyunkwania multivorans]|uniref:Uncharacterized protein n=1 Tax=Sungkyunkwania multivorans TaxID=1173618 RepID=A0ABW3D0U8_9FLAO